MNSIAYFIFVLAIIPALATSFRNHVQIDDLLNSDLQLFPNVTISHQMNLEDEVLEKFKKLLEDDEVLTKAYENFQMKYFDKGNQKGHHYNGHQRKLMFKDNLIYIFHHNLFARHKKSSTFEMGVNKFADMHLDEFKSERLGLIIPDETHDSHSHNHQTHHPHNDSKLEETSRSLPSHFDWRDHNVISPVKDQQKCGACVMFALTSALEGHHAICKNKQIIDLSEQFIIDCAVRENGYRKNKGCDGNTYPDSLQFAVDHGITSEHLYPYQGKQGSCKFDGMKPAVQLNGYRRLKDSPEDVKFALTTDGPVAIGMYVYKPFLFYKTGVYDQCGSPTTAVGGHAMAITGFRDEGNVKYYIIKNQWSEEWGENGFVRYTSSDPRCGLEKLAYSLQIKDC